MTKEIKEAKAYYDKAKVDGFTEDERLKLADEVFDIIEECIKLWTIIKKSIGLIKTKKLN